MLGLDDDEDEEVLEPCASGSDKMSDKIESRSTYRIECWPQQKGRRSMSAS